MPYSNFKERSHQFNSGIGKCPCMWSNLRVHIRKRYENEASNAQ